MAEATLNFDETSLDQSSDLFHLYDRLYQGMVKANEVEAPKFPSSEDLLVKDSSGNIIFDVAGNPILDSVKQADIDKISANFSDVLMKNSAYLFANSIMLAIGNGGGGVGGTSTTGFVSRGGDSMKGALSAWYGFDAGVNGHKIFEVSVDANEKKWSIVHGNLRVTEGAEVHGILNLDNGISFNGNETIYVDNGKLVIQYQDISLKGDISVDGTFSLGDVVISKDGILWEKNEFYHSGNSNKADVDWTMNNGTLYGDLMVKGNTSIGGEFSALEGFSLGALQKALFYSEVIPILDNDGNPINIAQVALDSDLRIINGHGIKFDDTYIINVRNANVLSISAPGMVMNLGDSEKGKKTEKRSLLWDICLVYTAPSPRDMSGSRMPSAS